MLGPHDGKKIQAYEITPMDGSAYVQGGNWRVFLSLYDGELGNATVLQHARLWAAETPAEKKALLTAWEAVKQLSPRGVPFEIDLPLPLAECRAT
jgi:hypothetical protein